MYEMHDSTVFVFLLALAGSWLSGYFFGKARAYDEVSKRLKIILGEHKNDSQE